jgi:ABC-type nitrate/sulfonate/bicarbonate transport system permease component
VRAGLKALALPLLLLVLAEVAARTFGIASTNLAAPTQIVAALGAALADGSLVLWTGQTLAAALAGLAVGGALGLAVAALIGLSPTAQRVLRLPIELFRPIPSVALLPVALLAFGFGYRLEIAVIAFACFWPVVIVGSAAIAGVERRLLEVGRVLRLGPLARLVKIVLPAALPRLFVAFRLAAGVALIVAVTVEIAMNPLGLGYAMMNAQETLRPALMFAVLVWIGLVGWALNALLVLAQGRLFGPAGLVEAPR